MYSGEELTNRAQCGVAILIDNKWKNKLCTYTYVNEWIVTVRQKTDRGYLTTIGVYAPEEGNAADTKLFYDRLQKNT